MYEEARLGEEAITVSGAIAARRREYVAGRTAARQALNKLGMSPGPIVTRSITHCAGCCIAVVADSTEAIGVGIDVESATPLPIELFRVICGDKDKGYLATLGPLGGKITFCAKEAFYKCYYATTREFLDFSDLSVRFASNRERDTEHFDAAITNPNRTRLPGGCRVTGRWFVAHGHILVGVSCAPEVPTRKTEL